MPQIFRYVFFILICSFYFNSVCYSVINIHQEAVRRNTSDLMIAENIADNILNTLINNGTKLEHGLDDIMNDHTENHHSTNDSYFRTNNRNTVRNIIKLVVSEADRFDITNIRGRIYLVLRKDFSNDESNRLIDKNNIGYDERF